MQRHTWLFAIWIAMVQDALDLIEFANGDVTTKWGKLRADMGHPASFNLKFIGIGNEQWGTGISGAPRTVYQGYS